MPALPSDYAQLLAALKHRVRAAQYRALQQVNREQMQLYWDVGQRIAERQQQQGWGKAVVETLARDLQREFVGMSGFSVQNLWYMRQFYLEYSASELLQPLVGEISWAKHLLIMARCKDPLERVFYTLQTQRQAWTKTVLAQQLKAQTYQKTVLAQHNFSTTLSAPHVEQAALALKDEYTFGFLALTAEHSEYELEQALLGNVRRFLQEMGGDFTAHGPGVRYRPIGRGVGIYNAKTGRYYFNAGCQRLRTAPDGRTESGPYQEITGWLHPDSHATTVAHGEPVP
jgi:predicted nuclease of restriction endonuclease-like (RecB) superfamily